VVLLSKSLFGFWSFLTGCESPRKKFGGLRIEDGTAGWRVRLALRFVRRLLFGQSAGSVRFSRIPVLGCWRAV
jgi:hypothetical protein